MKLNEVECEPIGTVTQSSFKHKWGTPRQGGLTPDSTAIISLSTLRQIPRGRVAVLWSAHLNSASFNPLKALIKPPKRPDAKVGVFATRGVHRPSPIGLTFCNVVSVEGVCVTVSGADMIEGTPVLCLTPCDELAMVKSVVMPEWTKVQEVKLRWSLASHLSIIAVAKKRGVDTAALTDLVEGVLRQDPRSVHSVRSHVNPVYEVELGQDPIWVIYRHAFAGEVEVVFISDVRIVDGFRSRTQEWLDRLLDKIPFIR